jgi:hypothetical protein
MDAGPGNLKFARLFPRGLLVLWLAAGGLHAQMDGRTDRSLEQIDGGDAQADQPGAAIPLLAGLAATPSLSAGPAEHTDRPLVLVHYMPWFAAKPIAREWGWHWTMNAFDPEKLHDGKRSIASHYYPLIGPYDSGDPAVIEYHLLLIKLAGFDGLIVDWCGLSKRFDYPLLHRNTAALFLLAAKFGLKIAICYEDQTIPKLVPCQR